MSLLHGLSGIYFHAPGWLWAWPVVVLGLFVLSRHSQLEPPNLLPKPVSLRRFRHPQLELLRSLFGDTGGEIQKPRSMRRALVYSVASLGVLAALAHPYRLGQELPTPPQYRDTIFLVDSSISMLRRDYLVDGRRVDRMTMLKSVMNHFIDQLEGNRISLVAFSEQSYTLVPLTEDYRFLQHMVRRLEPALFTGSRSDISKAMLYTLQKMRRNTGQQSDSDRPVLVLLTDVNRPVRDIDPRAAATFLAQQGFRMHVIAIGSPSYAADEHAIASIIYHPVNFSLLKKIAVNAGGKFFWAKNVHSLQQAMLAIQQAERRHVTVEPRRVHVSLYQWPLLASLVWIMAIQSWPVKGRRT